MLKNSIRNTAVFAVLGAVMFATTQALSGLPNIHILAPIICASTVVYGVRALYPIYVFVFMSGLFTGFSAWWLPYLYVWAVLWGAVMLLPNRISNTKKPWALMIASALHGLLFGTLYAPAQALMFGFDIRQTLLWILAGLPYDAIHGVSNFLMTALLAPAIIRVLRIGSKQ